MVIAYFFLLILYLGLTLLYAWTTPTPTPLAPWPLLAAPKTLSETPVHCQVDADCASYHVCLGQTCVPKLLRGGQCHPDTGRWMTYQLKKLTFAICTCLNPDVFTQKFFGGDCNVSIGCGVHGHYNLTLKKCECDRGYKEVQRVGRLPTCQKIPVFEDMDVCEPDELDVQQLDAHGFHPDYAARFVHPAPCVKRPCTFDAFTGRPLKHGKFEPNWGCVCDPRYGLFGVVLKGQNKTYLNTEGFDACASIFVRDPHRPIEVKLITYFYLGHRDPVSLIQFHVKRVRDLIPLLRGKQGPWTVEQSIWKYDYAQYFFKQNQTFRARTRTIVNVGLFGITYENEFDYREHFSPTSCAHLHPLVSFSPTKQNVYKALYGNPVCYMHDLKHPPLLQERVIVNPQHLTLRDPTYDNYDRYNAFVLHYEPQVGLERWTLDLDYPYRVWQYRANPSNVPVYP